MAVMTSRLVFIGAVIVRRAILRQAYVCRFARILCISRLAWTMRRGCPSSDAAMTTLLTGATGFVGSAVARTLLARGHTLRLLVRPGSDRSNLTGLDAELVAGRSDRRRVPDAGGAGLPLCLPCGRGLPALGAGPSRHDAGQCGGHAVACCWRPRRRVSSALCIAVRWPPSGLMTDGSAGRRAARRCMRTGSSAYL